MNRRDALKAAAVIAGATGTANVIDAKRPIVAVVTFPHKLTREHIERMRRQWSCEMAGTEFAGLPLVIMDGGATFQVVEDQRGDA